MRTKALDLLMHSSRLAYPDGHARIAAKGVDMRAVILALVSSMMAAPATAADQFDLVCKGQNRTSPIGGWRPVEKHYRVDLGANKWCQDRCIALEDIAKVERDKITFREQMPKYENDGLVDERIDRVTGKWTDYVSGSGGLQSIYWESEGSCEPIAFSGFPALATKF